MKHYVLVSVLLVSSFCSATHENDSSREQKADEWAQQKSAELGDFNLYNPQTLGKKPRCLRGNRGNGKTLSQVVSAYARAQNKR